MGERVANALGSSNVPTLPPRIGGYRIVRQLKSSRAKVFLALDDHERQLVLKVLASSGRNRGMLDPKIADEATAYAGLAHPNIVRVVDLFSADGDFVIVLEHVDGAPLNVVQAGFRRAGVALSTDAALHIGVCIFSAVAAAHAARAADGRPAAVVHRNINPSNVLVDWGGTAKLGNFNVANVALLLRDSQPGITWGSYGYLAPEQVRGEAAGPAADVYAATVVLWELLAGRKAIQRGTLSDAEILSAMASPSITPLEHLRPDLDAGVLQAVRFGLQPDPAKRAISAEAMRKALVAAIDAAKGQRELGQALGKVRAHASPTSDRQPQEHRPVPTPLRPATVPTPRGSYCIVSPAEARDEAPPLARPMAVSERVSPPAVGGRRKPGRASIRRLLEKYIAGKSEPPAAPDAAAAAAAGTPPPQGRPRPGRASIRRLLQQYIAGPPESPDAPRAEPSAARAGESFRAVAASTGGAGGVSLDPAPSDVRPKRTAAPRPRRLLLLSAAVVVSLAAAAFVSVPHRSSTATAQPSVAAAAAPAPPRRSAPLPASPSSASPPPRISSAAPAATTSAGAAPALDTSTYGELIFGRRAAGHRIFVDGRVVGEGVGPIRIHCGVHTVRVGSAGTAQSVVVPCNDSVLLP